MVEKRGAFISPLQAVDMWDDRDLRLVLVSMSARGGPLALNMPHHGDRETPLTRAVASGSLGMVRRLLQTRGILVGAWVGR